MKLRYIFVIIFLACFIILTYFISNYSILNVKETFSGNSDKYELKNLKESNDKYVIDIYYPQTSYDALNIKIKSCIQNIVEDFKTVVGNASEDDYILEISFNYYEYENYISFAFNVFRETGGAHPNTNTFTINYDINNNVIVDITELTKRYNNILDVFYNISYECLKNDEKIIKYGNEDMLEKGLEKKIENYMNFVFDKNGIILFFNPYDVAPYVAGDFIVRIPYNKLNTPQN